MREVFRFPTPMAGATTTCPRPKTGKKTVQRMVFVSGEFNGYLRPCDVLRLGFEFRGNGFDGDVAVCRIVVRICGVVGNRGPVERGAVGECDVFRRGDCEDSIGGGPFKCRCGGAAAEPKRQKQGALFDIRCEVRDKVIEGDTPAAEGTSTP